MPQKLLWTPARDAVLVHMRTARSDWGKIGAALNISRNAATERGRRLNARLGPDLTLVRVVLDPDRPSMPPGDPVSWGALVEGTVLSGTAYPRPAAMGRRHAGAIGEMC